MNPKKKYEELILKYEKIKNECEKMINRISNIRLVSFIAGIAVCIFLYVKDLYLPFFAGVVGFGILFIAFVIKHQNFIEKKKYSDALLEINKKSLKRAEGKWHEFKDTGKEYSDIEHNYSYDLDVFGKSSLFQWINTTITTVGREALVNMLLNPLKSIGEILTRQDAVLELSRKLEWRQTFTAEAMIVAKKTNHIDNLIDWANEPIKFINKRWAVILARIIPVIMITMACFTFVFNLIPVAITIAVLVVATTAMFIHHLFVAKKFAEFGKYKDDILIYTKLFNLIENENFESELIKNVISDLKLNHYTACSQMKKLVKISDMIEIRRNMFYIAINGIFLWDLQCLIAYERWKKQSGEKIKKWLEVIAWFEAMSSLSNIYFDNPNWVKPEFYETKKQIFGQEVGHPFLGDARVCNDVSIGENANTLLITGSNMSGKSTFLRTIGISLLMSYIGLPVCAKQFKSSIMDIYTCMRISDDLSQNISSFYAELLRIKKIIDNLGDENTIFFLLDEIFKGTNSIDRHTGSKKLVGKLSNSNAAGLVSTHDLELGELENASKGKIKNYHFEEHYEDTKICFDYKLRGGLSTTRNAVYLMKIIGLDV